MAFRAVYEWVEIPGVLMDLFASENPDAVIHLADQAGCATAVSSTGWEVDPVDFLPGVASAQGLPARIHGGVA